MADTKTQLTYCQEVSESLKLIFDLTSRIDERIKIINKEIEVLQKKSENSIKVESQGEGRMYVLESSKKNIEDTIKDLQCETRTMELKLQQLEMKTEGHDTKWKTIISFAVQIAWVILASYLLLKLGIQNPPLP